MATIKELRLKKLWSQAKLAKLSGVSRTTIVAIIDLRKAKERVGLPETLDRYMRFLRK